MPVVSGDKSLGESLNESRYCLDGEVSVKAAIGDIKWGAGDLSQDDVLLGLLELEIGVSCISPDRQPVTPE